MSDNEIIEALECCNSKKRGNCLNCQYHNYSANCLDDMMNDVLDLINRQKAEIERLKETIKELDLGRTLKTYETTDLRNKCGSCIYAKPTVFGKSKSFVECTNREHGQRYCKREISRKRARTQPACKSYKELTEKGN